MRLAVWSPLPPSPSGIADYVAEQVPCLQRHAELVLVVEEPRSVDPALARSAELARPEPVPSADLHVYHLGNSPPHGYVYRAALARPGVAFLHDSNLHHVVLHETLERGDAPAYLKQMRRAYGETGAFVGRQVARALGGELPALFPLHERVLEASLAVVGLTRHVCAVAAELLPERPRLQLPHHAWLPAGPLPSRAEARRALGLEAEAFVVTAPGLATASKRLDVAVRVAGRLARTDPALRLVIAGAVDPQLPLRAWAVEAGLAERLRVTGRLSLSDFVAHLAAADVVLALRYPSHGEMSGALVRALAVGRPVLVSSGSTPAAELPEGVVVPIDPGPGEERQLQAALERLRADAALRAALSSLARRHVARAHDLETGVARLAGFLAQVLERKPQLEAAVAAARAAGTGLLGYLVDELRGPARELGLPGAAPALAPLLEELVGRAP